MNSSSVRRMKIAKIGHKLVTSCCFSLAVFGFLSLLLLLSGDIQINPGPIKHPCSLCERSVKSNQRAILCDGCGYWTHCRCSGVSKFEYLVYQQSTAPFNWYCPRCLASELPFHDCSHLTFHSHNDSIGVISDISHVSHQQAYGNLSTLFSGKSNLSFVHINVRSLLSSIDDICNLLLECRVDIMAITETWLDETVSDSEVCPPSYRIVQRDRNRHGGGVAFIVSDRVTFQHVSVPVNDDIIESLWIKVFPLSVRRSMLFGCVYRSPSSFQFFDNLLNQCEFIQYSQKCKRMSIIGDLNCDLLRPSLSQTKLFQHFCDSMQFVQLVNEPTRVIGGTASLLDVLLTNHVECFRVSIFKQRPSPYWI